MSTDERALRERLGRLERAMPDALPRDLREVVGVARPRLRPASAWPVNLLVLLGAMLAGLVVGGGGVLLLAPRPSQAPVLPAGLYRSATPVRGPVCVAMELPVRSGGARLPQQRIWWWPRGPEGCGQRTDFIYVQWVQPTPAQVAGADGVRRDAVRFELVVELRDGARHDLDFVLDPLATAAEDGSVPTYRSDSGAEGVRLLPIDDYAQIEEVSP